MARTTLIKLMRRAKRDVLNLIDTFISKSNSPKVCSQSVRCEMSCDGVTVCAADRLQFIAESFLPHLLEPLLLDYQRNVASARNPEVLSVMTSTVLKLKGDVNVHVPRIMEGVFRCTLEQLMGSFIDHPEHRLNFFKLLEALITTAFPVLFSLDGETVKLVVDSLIWGFKHPQRDIAETVSGCWHVSWYACGVRC